MDTELLVESALEEGKKLIEKLLREGFELMAAFWLKGTEKGSWRFYVVSSVADSKGIAEGYRRLDTAMRPMPQFNWIDPLEIKLIGPSDPIAAEVLAVYASVLAPKSTPLRWRGIMLGNLSIDGAYIYPQPAAPVV